MSKFDIERHKALKAQKESARTHTAQLMNLANVMGSDNMNAMVEGMVEAMVQQHRFVQQEFMTALQTALYKYSESAGTDARNDFAVKWAKNASELPTF